MSRKSSLRFPRKNRFALPIAGALCVFVFLCFIFLGGTQEDELTHSDLASDEVAAEIAEANRDVELSAQQAAESDELAEADIAAELNTMYGTIGSGDTVSGILQAWLNSQEISLVDTACKDVFSLRRIKHGQPYAVHCQEGNLLRFEYEIDNDSRLVVTRTEDGFTAEQQDIEYEIRLCRVDGEITSNMFQSMSDVGEGATLAVQLADVFAWEINFIRDIRAGDKFSLLVEKRYRDGEFKDYGKLLAANFVNQSEKYEAFLFRDDDGNSQYYTRDGQNIRRAFLKAPLSYTRISSGYSHRRLHPVTMNWKAHPAIDYAAPTGTPVKSVGKGKITFMGYDKASGNYIKVEHMNGYETMYLHLSSFAKGLKKGSKVAQGQVIGFVGKTGYATGPHLDFRMKKDRAYVNPLKVLSPRETPVSKEEMMAFKGQLEIFMAFFEDKIDFAEYDRSMLSNVF